MDEAVGGEKKRGGVMTNTTTQCPVLDEWPESQLFV